MQMLNSVAISAHQLSCGYIGDHDKNHLMGSVFLLL